MRPNLLQMTALLSAFLMIGGASLAQDVPQTINHQGYVEVDGTPFDGTGSFRFALVGPGGDNLWTHDNSQVGTTNMPDTAKNILVRDGVYSTALGGSTPILDDVFTAGPNVELRVWFDDGSNGVQELTPPQPLRSVPFARVAGTANGVSGVITVDRVEYTMPRTKYLSLKGADFLSTPQESNLHASGNINGLTVDPGVSFFAPVHLPDGATIVSMTLHFDDQDGDTDVQAVLRVNDMANNILFQPLTVDTSGVTGEGSNTATASPGIVVDNQTNHYQVRLEDFSDDWDNCNILGVVIEYELGEAL